MSGTLPGEPNRHRRRLGPAGAVLLAAAALAAGCTREPEQRWNVLIAVPDTVRADHLSVNGYGRETTPSLDKLAAEGANFTQALTVAPQTWQSFTSILTGLYPPHHGVRFIGDYALSPEIPTLATILSAAGYETHAFDQVKWVRQMIGDRGFEGYTERLVAQQQLLDETWEWLATRGVRDDGSGSRPFFAFVKLAGTHWPYDEDGGWSERFEPCDGIDHSFNQGLTGLKTGKEGEGFEMAQPGAYHRLHYAATTSERQRRHMIAHYDGELRHVDDLIGKLIERLRAGGLLERTIVVVTSDHGEALGERGYYQHGPMLDETVVRVPLIIRLPLSHPAARPGATVDGVARTVDILPTVLAAVSVEAPERLDGDNLLPAIAGEPIPADRWAYAESGRSFVGQDPDRHIAGVEGKMRMVRDARRKLIFVPKADGAEIRLFDLQADPGETRDIAAEQPAVVEEMKKRLEPLLVQSTNPRPERTLSEAEKEQLRQLGYM